MSENLEKDKYENPVTFGGLADDSLVYDEQGSGNREEAEQRFLDKINLETLNWEEYDRDVFNIYKSTDMSFRTMSRFSNISHTNLFHTVKRCKEKLNDALNEDWEDLNNEDYEQIIVKFARNWEIDRIAKMDQLFLKMAFAEILSMPSNMIFLFIHFCF